MYLADLPTDSGDAQSSLSNLFAGLQLAFTDAIRVDDVVVVEGEWGRIEEITLTYVVVHIWDDRRLIMPSTYFTTTPFQNWTRKESAVLGAVELDVDWRVPLDDLRIELDRALQASEIWDERVGILQVTDAVGSVVRVRVLVSGVDGPTVFDLRCEVREALVGYLQREHPDALPRIRVESWSPASPGRRTWARRWTTPCRQRGPLAPDRAGRANPNRPTRRACSPAAARRSGGPGGSPAPATNRRTVSPTAGPTAVPIGHERKQHTFTRGALRRAHPSQVLTSACPAVCPLGARAASPSTVVDEESLGREDAPRQPDRWYEAGSLVRRPGSG